MAAGVSPRVWGFALGNGLAALLERFTALVEEDDFLAWVLIPIPGAQMSTLKIPPGYEMVERE